MTRIPEEDYIISDHPLIRGKKVAPGWWTKADGYSMKMKQMSDEHLRNSIKYIKRRITENTLNDDYSIDDMAWDAFMLLQLTDEWYSREYDKEPEYGDVEKVSQVMKALKRAEEI